MSENLSERAQEIRKQVLKPIDQRVSEKVDDIFDWILKLFEKKLEKYENYGIEKDSSIVVGYDINNKMMYGGHRISFSLSSVASLISLKECVKILKERIDKEEGYKCEIISDPDKGIINLKVTIE